MSISAATAQLRFNICPPDKGEGSLWGGTREDHRPFLATRGQNTRDSRAMLALAVDSTYWQQRVAYEIVAAVDEPSGVLSGNVRIKYVNQSPDTLRDFYVHQYLNAFRPASRWAAVDSAEWRERFQHMQDPDYAFERITQASLGTPDYPYAPDSTIAHWRLPRPLAPGDSMGVTISWQARPSTLPRRQGRRGRRFDFAQWYPKVVVYDKYGWEDHPLYPAGEFYGEFASYDVTLDLAADQVIGATGVPVEGDPGWEKANANPRIPVEYQRNYYDARRARARLVRAANASASTLTQSIISRSRSIPSTATKRVATKTSSCVSSICLKTARPGAKASPCDAPKRHSAGSTRSMGSSRGRRSRTCTASRAAALNSP